MKWIFGLVLMVLIAAMPFAGATADSDTDIGVQSPDVDTSLSWRDMQNPEKLSEKIAAADAAIDNSVIGLQRTQTFLLWTNDLTHYMHGEFANGFFNAVDDRGVRVYGIYNGNFWAGIYKAPLDGSTSRWYLFFGKLGNERWSAYGVPTGEPGIFGSTFTHGRYVTEKHMRG